jgi:hypothetical protein
MRIYKLSSALLVATILLSGCASSSTIQRVSESKSQFDGAVYGGETNIASEDTSGGEQYRVFHQGATGFVSVQSIRVSAEKRAAEFCERKNKVVKTLRERTSKPPHILGNYPRIEIIFTCVDKPILTVPTVYEDARFIKLNNLKKLLDDGVITKQEFDTEKAKVLSQP